MVYFWEFVNQETLADGLVNKGTGKTSRGLSGVRIQGSEPRLQGGALNAKAKKIYPTLKTMAAPVSPAAQPAHRP